MRKSNIMYAKPEVEMIIFNNSDVITTSLTGSDGGDNSTDYPWISSDDDILNN